MQYHGSKSFPQTNRKKFLKVYHAKVKNPGERAYESEAERWFCRECGAHLYLLDESYPEGFWPNAGVIDTPLPVPPERVHLMMKSKANWVPVMGKGPRYPRYPALSIEDWHKKHRLTKK